MTNVFFKKKKKKIENPCARLGLCQDLMLMLFEHLFVCMCMSAYVIVCVWTRGQHSEISSLLLPCGYHTPIQVIRLGSKCCLPTVPSCRYLWRDLMSSLHLYFQSDIRQWALTLMMIECARGWSLLSYQLWGLLLPSYQWLLSSRIPS